MTETSTPYDIIIVGAGAAGLTAAIFAGQTVSRGRRVLLLDGSKTPGLKILASGGTRCNVTHVQVTPDDYNGGPRTIIRNILRAFDLPQTLVWMKELGVALKLESTGKYFPVTDQARTVLDALLRRAREVGVEFLFSTRVNGLRPLDAGEGGDGFELSIKAAGGGEGTAPLAPLHARRVIFATGGRSLPKSGSDGAGLELMRGLGHTIVPTTPALSPLVLRPSQAPGGRFAELSGLTLDLRLSLFSAQGKPLAEWTGSLVFTHFGISGPAALNISRHWLRARLENPGAPPRLCLGHPALKMIEDADQWILKQTREHPKQLVASALMELYPERLARLLAEGMDEDLAHLPRDKRREAAERLARLPLDVEGDRGYSFAETTAGGIDLREIDPRTMQSRVLPGLFLCGEMLDCDGRLGGFNFQWAWASGSLAGRSAAAGLGKE